MTFSLSSTGNRSSFDIINDSNHVVISYSFSLHYQFFRSKYTRLKKVFMLKEILGKVFIFAVPVVKSLQGTIFLPLPALNLFQFIGL
jgi:hypothetical protein